jgi:ubiquinone biosynthesis protein UbiJ
MPGVQALSGLIEVAINQALALSLNGKKLLLPLEGKRFVVYLQELEATFAFVFSDNCVDVMMLAPVEQEVLDNMPANECYISVSLFALPELKHTSQLTKLIKQNKLDFYGDLGIAQKFSQVINDIEFDFEETLSTYIGDAGAYTVMSKGEQWQAFAKKQHKVLMSMLSDAALEQKPIAVRPIMLTHFTDQVRQLKMDADRLEARLNLLAAKKEEQ